VSVTPDEVIEAAGGRGALTADILREELLSDAHHAYDAREELLGAEVMREVERRVVLSVLDRKWREHLYEMDYLQEGIGLRAMAQRDPLVEYQREGFQLFQAMMESIKEESVGYLFNVNVEVEQPTPAPAVAPMSVTDMLAGSGLAGAGTAEAPAAEGAAAAAPAGVAEAAEAQRRHEPLIRAKGLEQPTRASQLHYSAPTAEGGVEERDVTGRGTTLTDEQLEGTPKNAPCPCGSGKKFKMCHGASH